jgi:uncharacterized protein YdhG (YjbR/CyaY superfamily)
MSATIDEYLAGLPDDQRAALGLLRQQIQAAAPEATESISYGVPGFKLGGRYLVGFGATREGCSFYTGRAPIEAYGEELTGYRLGKGTISYPPDLPLPAELVSRLVNVRVAERRSR